MVCSQSTTIKTLIELKMNPISPENDESFISLTREKLNVIDDVTTINFVRETKGLSLLEAKKFVDSLKQ